MENFFTGNVLVDIYGGIAVVVYVIAFIAGTIKALLYNPNPIVVFLNFIPIGVFAGFCALLWPIAIISFLLRMLL